MAGDGDSSKVTDALEHESDLMPTASSPFNEISRHIRKTGIMRMEEFPMGRRAGKVGEGRKIVLAYVREGPRRAFYAVIFDYSTKTAEVADDMEAIRIVRCGEDEEPYLPMDSVNGRESFGRLMEIDGIAREAIGRRNSEDEKMAAKLRSKPKKSERTIEHFREVMDGAIDDGNLTEHDAEEADSILDSADLRQWGDYIERLLDECDTGSDVRRAINELKKIGKEMAARDKEDARATTDPGRLILVGALFVTASDEARTDLEQFEQF